MSTVIRPEISQKKPYYISKHRYYELVHFCLQYPEWEKEYHELGFYRSGTERNGYSNAISDPTGSLASRLATLESKMKLIEDTAIQARPDLWVYIFKSVTEGRSFAYFEALGIPCGKDLFYEMRRKFFWLLDARKTAN